MKLFATMPDSIWAATARQPAPSFRAPDADAQAEVAIVGGGIAGLSAAIRLAQAGRNVAVLEAATIGAGASGVNGGQVNPGLKLTREALEARFGAAGATFYRFAQGAPDFLAASVARLELDCGFEQSGLLRLAHNAAALQTVRSACSALVEEGVPAQQIDAARAAELTGTSSYVGGLLDPRGGRLHPLDFTRALAARAVMSGCRIYEGTTVEQIEVVGDDIELRIAHGARFRCGQVLVATNAFPSIMSRAATRSMAPATSYQVATAPLPGRASGEILPQGHTVYDTRRLIIYFRRLGDRLVFGGRPPILRPSKAWRDQDSFRILEAAMRGCFPSLGDTPVAHRWSGNVAVTMDQLPHYHHPDPRIHTLLGCNGRGVALFHRAGNWIAERILGDDEPGLPSTPARAMPLHQLRHIGVSIAPKLLHALDKWR